MIVKNTVPTWYWKRGLHDAEIVDVGEKYDRENVNMLITIDSQFAMFESTIESIELVNYDCDCDLNFMKDCIWIDDELTMNDKGYRLKITLQKGREFFDVIVTFERAIVVG